MTKHKLNDIKTYLDEIKAMQDPEPKDLERLEVYECVLGFCDEIKNNTDYEITDIDFSSASVSTYVTIEEPNEWIDCTVRFSNHQAKPYHQFHHDIDYNTGHYLDHEMKRVTDFLENELNDVL